MHGFVLLAIAFMLRGQITAATIAMTLAINFKQMALYFCIPFAVYALQLIASKNSLLGTSNMIVWLLVVFTATNLVIWLPWLVKDNAFDLEGA